MKVTSAFLSLQCPFFFTSSLHLFSTFLTCHILLFFLLSLKPFIPPHAFSVSESSVLISSICFSYDTHKYSSIQYLFSYCGSYTHVHVHMLVTCYLFTSTEAVSLRRSGFDCILLNVLRPDSEFKILAVLRSPTDKSLSLWVCIAAARL